MADRRSHMGFDHHNMTPADAGAAVPQVIWKTQDGITLAYGTTLPAAAAGYVKGCLFVKTGGGDEGIYTNRGTTASSNFAVFTAATFVGDVTGDVTGDLTGTVTGPSGDPLTITSDTDEDLTVKADGTGDLNLDGDAGDVAVTGANVTVVAAADGDIDLTVSGGGAFKLAGVTEGAGGVGVGVLYLDAGVLKVSTT